MSAEKPVSPPRWARAVDLACLLLVITAIIVATFGGFRLRFGTARFALTSPYRLLLWAAVAAVVRHFAAPGAPIYRDLLSRIRVWWSAEPVRSARVVFVGTRPAILLAGYLAVFMIGYPRAEPPFRMFDNEFLNLQMRWDTGWYVGIALNGYQYDAAHPEIQQNIVFFPAFPILTRVTARLLGGSSTVFLLAGTLIALAAFLGALVYLFRLAREMLGDTEQARAAIWLLAAYPFALFYSAVYTESLFLLAAVGTFYHFRRGEFWRAACWGLLVGLTRPNGSFMCMPLGIIALAPWLPRWLTGGSASERTMQAAPARRRQIVWALATAAAPVLGLLIYSAFIWQMTGHPFLWAQGQAAWGRQYNGLAVLVSQRYEWLSQGGLYDYTSNNPEDFVNVLGPLFVLGSSWFVARRLGLAYAAFLLINTLPPLAVGGFLSAGRMSAVMFPSFIWLGSAVPARQRSAWIAGFMAFQAFNATLFYTWRSLY